ncbi:MAG: caspase family protein [Cyanobacteriota bacterium]|nr:caspase family protein [Cyanobacteriota bacterium]
MSHCDVLYQFYKAGRVIWNQNDVHLSCSNGPADSNQLRYALNDVERMRNALSNQRCGFNVESPDVEDDIWDIGRQLSRVASSCSRNDTFICYFSGHGFAPKGSLYLLLNNSDISNLHNTALSVDTIITPALDNCKAQSKLLILDCCHAGAIGNRIKSGSEVKENEIVIKSDNYLVLLAADRLEKAREIDELQGSFLTANICAAIGEQSNEADIQKDGRISVFIDLKTWLEKKCQEYNTKQTKEEYYVPQPYIQGKCKGEIFLTLPPSSSSEFKDCEVFPYQALDPFSKKTAYFLFGRKRVVKDLQEALEKSNFVLLIGNSGSGKSSVVKAALTSELEENSWLVLEPIVPWGEPVSYLKYEVTQRLFEDREKIQEIHSLIETNGLASITENIPGEQQILIIVDQFEEVFTLCSKKLEQRKFIELLTQVADTSFSRLKVVVTLRADFVEDCLNHKPLAALIQNQSVWIPDLEQDDLKDVIIEPAKKLNYSFDEGLPESIIEEVSREENFLPLLQFALTELWKHRDKKNKKITATQYLKQGRILGLLNSRSEEIYQGFNEQEKKLTKRILLKLVRTGIGNKDTRQRQPKQKLLAIAGDNSEQQIAIQNVLNKLIKERLLVTGNDSEGVAWIDLAHEALMERWERFSLWRKENRELRRLFDKVEDYHKEWLEYKKDTRFLMMGGVLLQVEEKWSDMEQEFSAESEDFKEFYELSKSAQDIPEGCLKQKLEEQERKHLLELHKYQIEAVQNQAKIEAKIELYKSQLEAKDALIENYKEHNQKIEKIALNLSQNQTNVVVQLDSQMKPEEKHIESFSNNFQGSNISGGVVINKFIYEEKQSLAKAAAEIQELLEQLGKSYSQDRTSQEMTDYEKMTIASEAIKEIESNPILKQRIIDTLKDSGTTALREALDNPIANVLVAAFEGWVEK